MRAVLLEQFGGPDVLRCTTVDAPKRGSGEVLVRVRACGVCGHDLLARRGALKIRLPQILGHEIAGEIAESDDSKGGFSVGDRVVLNQRIACGACAACRRGQPNLCTTGPGFYGEDIPGGYAEYVRARASNLVRFPDAVPFDVAATLPCGVSTGLHAIRRARLKPRETVLITGATGGVGIHAIALARLEGATVIAVTRRAASQAALSASGAHEVVLVGEHGFHSAVRDRFGEGVDVVVECVGTPTFYSSVRSLRRGGRMIMVGNVQPGTIELGLGALIVKELDLLGSSHATIAELAEAVELVEKGRLTTQIARQFPLEDAANAHRFAEEVAHTGRIVLNANGE